MLEVVKKPSSTRKAGISALLCHAMRGTSLKFHSKAERVLRLLMDNSIFRIGDNFKRGKFLAVDDKINKNHFAIFLALFYFM